MNESYLNQKINELNKIKEVTKQISQSGRLTPSQRNMLNQSAPQNDHSGKQSSQNVKGILDKLKNDKYIIDQQI